MIHLRPKDYRVMPWKDGGGVTVELAIDPPGAELTGAFAWRLSSARVEASGSFSRFPGRRRDLVLLEGAGFELSVGNRTEALRDFLYPIRFSGDEDARATLVDGAAVDLGLIWDPSRIRAEVTPLRVGEAPIPVALATLTLLVAPQGGLSVEPLARELGAMDCLRLEGAMLDSAVVVHATRPREQVPLVIVRLWPPVSESRPRPLHP